MTEPTIGHLEARVSQLESAIAAGLARIEMLIRQEIQDLKTEQLRDIKGNIERVENDTKASLARIENDLKDEHTRLADDQRRLWDRLVAIEQREGQRIGGGKMLGSIAHVISALIGGLISAGVGWLSRGSPPHP